MSSETHPVKATYLGFDKRKCEYYCQVKVPADLRHCFGSTIRKKTIGLANKLPMEVILARKDALAHQFFAEFDALRVPRKEESRAGAEPVTSAATGPAQIVSFELTPEIAARAASTAMDAEAQGFLLKFEAVRAEPSRERRQRLFDELAQQQKSLHIEAKALQRDGCGDLASAEIETLQEHHHVQFLGNGAARNGFTVAFNAARVAYLAQTIAVCDGGTSATTLRPDPKDQLPLLEIWGNSVESAVQKWEQKGIELRKPRDPKTLDKYKQIARTLAPLLGRRPLETISAVDVAAFVEACRPNSDRTVDTKLGILSTLVAQYDETQTVCEAIDDARELLSSNSPGRLKFTLTQLSALLHGVFNDGTLHSSHKHITCLAALTAARLEEVCQLRGTDIELERSADDEAYWLVRIASAAAAGSGDARLKNLQSNRRLPVMVGTLPDLDAFLNSRVGTSERLFPNLTPDRYDKLSTAASKVLNRRLDQIFPNRDRRLVFQSLRTTAAVAMRSAEICGPRRVRFLGHAPESVHQRHYEADYQLDADDLLPAATFDRP